MAQQLNDEQKQEYKRWQGYANALLLASTVLFAGTTIALPKQVVSVSILSIVFGLIAIVLAVLWFALENNQKILGKPAFLWLASCSFGGQAGFLFVALLAAFLSKGS